MGDHLGVGGGGAHDREVGRGVLVELDQLVALRAAQPSRPDQCVEALPRVLVREHVGVEVHAVTLGSGRSRTAPVDLRWPGEQRDPRGG